eukprot:scaffold558_cov120-Isochrysis_galbana.AAC.5
MHGPAPHPALSRGMVSWSEPPRADCHVARPANGQSVLRCSSAGVRGGPDETNRSGSPLGVVTLRRISTSAAPSDGEGVVRLRAQAEVPVPWLIGGQDADGAGRLGRDGKFQLVLEGVGQVTDPAVDQLGRAGRGACVGGKRIGLWGGRGRAEHLFKGGGRAVHGCEAVSAE